MTPTPVRADSPRGIETNGIGKQTTAHLNLTRSMTPKVYAQYHQNRFTRKGDKA